MGVPDGGACFRANIARREINWQDFQSHLLASGEVERLVIVNKSVAKVYLRPALAAGRIERTLPTKPRSSSQRYRRTAEAAARGLWSTLATPQVTPQVVELLEVLEGELTRAVLMERVGLKDRKHFARAYLRPALEAGVIEMTIPDKPRSRSQRYRRTARGRRE